MRKMKRRPTKPAQVNLFGEPWEETKPRQPGEIIPLDFETKAVRMIFIKGRPWWYAFDVCRVLTIKNPSDAFSRLDDDEKTTLVNSEGRPRNLINEAGLWSLVLSSSKPEAKRFKRWLTHEVLPTIRSTGSYSPQQSRIQKKAKELGCTEKTAEQRCNVIDGNKKSAARLQSEGTPRGGYPAWFDALNQAQFGRKSADLKRWLGLKKWQVPLDHMGELPLSQRSHAICLAERKIEDAQMLAGKPLTLDAQLEIVYETVRSLVKSDFQCLGDEHVFFIRDDQKRGKLLDVTRQLQSV